MKKQKKIYFKDEIFMAQVGAKIRTIRNEKGISIDNLANEFGFDYSQLARMELGKVNFSISYLKKIASCLQIDPKELLP